MNLLRSFSNLFKSVEPEKEVRSSLVSPDQWLTEWVNGGPVVAGQSVTPETALKVSAVYAACNLLSRTIASLSLAQFERMPNGGVNEINTTESLTLTEEPHPFYTSYSWRSTAMLHLCLRGNHYSRLYFDRNGRVNKVEILHPDAVEPFIYKNNLYYRVALESGTVVLMSDEVLHFKNFADDGILGKSPLTYARETIGMSLASSSYSSTMYANGGGLKGIITAPGMLQDKQVQGLREGMMSVMKDYERTGSIGVLQSGATFQQVAISPRDAQFIENAKFSVSDIARFYGVPLHLIGDLDRSTNNNIEHQSIEFVMHCIRPHVKAWEAEINRKCVRISDKGKVFFRFNIDSLLRGDSASRAQYYAQMLNLGVYSIDEVRKLENLNPVSDGTGSQHFIQSNMTTLSNIINGNGDTQN